MELPQREERLVTNGTNRNRSLAQWRSTVVASLAAAQVTRRNPIANHFSFITIPEHSLLVIEQPFLTP
jgi:hypothetical protein